MKYFNPLKRLTIFILMKYGKYTYSCSVGGSMESKKPFIIISTKFKYAFLSI